jgi:acyl-CoA dehydrogenase
MLHLNGSSIPIMNRELPAELEPLRVATQTLVKDLLLHEGAFQRSNVVPAEVDTQLRALGYYGMRIPEIHGGTALGMLASVAVVSELGRLPPQFWSFLRVALGPSTKALVQHGTPAQQARWLPAIARGEAGVAFVLTEAEAGSDLSAMRTQAVAVPGGYVLNGAKTYISNANKAQLFIVFARTSQSERLKGGISTFLIEPGQQGMQVGPPMPTMGTTLDGLFEVNFTDAFVPQNCRLGVEGEGFQHAMASLNEGRVNVGAIAIGMGRYALELATAHVKSRVAFGQTLASNQAVQHMLANAAIELHAGWLMVLDAARRMDAAESGEGGEGGEGGAEGTGGAAGKQAGALSAMVKVFCTEAASRAIDSAVQLFGAAGYTRGYAVERLYRDVRVLRIYEGASEVLRNIVARQVLAA